MATDVPPGEVLLNAIRRATLLPQGPELLKECERLEKNHGDILHKYSQDMCAYHYLTSDVSEPLGVLFATFFTVITEVVLDFPDEPDFPPEFDKAVWPSPHSTSHTIEDGVHTLTELLHTLAKMDDYEEQQVALNVQLKPFVAHDDQIRWLAVNYVFSREIEAAVGNCPVLRLAFLFCKIAKDNDMLYP